MKQCMPSVLRRPEQWQLDFSAESEVPEAALVPSVAEVPVSAS